jgi:L-fuconolactonase
MAAGQNRFRGVRALTHWHSDGDIHRISVGPGVLAASCTRDAVTAVHRLGLSLDVWVYHTQLGEVVDLCRALPALPVVINHVGTPLGCGMYRSLRREVLDEWRTRIAELAALPKVFMKIGGMAMRFNGFEFDHLPTPPSSDMLLRAWQPYVEICIAAFGPSRCMFESNFPVDKASCSYAVLWNAFKKLCAAYSRDEKVRMLGGTAAEVYSITL